MPLHATHIHPAQRDILMDLLINAENSTYNVGGNPDHRASPQRKIHRRRRNVASRI